MNQFSDMISFHCVIAMMQSDREQKVLSFANLEQHVLLKSDKIQKNCNT